MLRNFFRVFVLKILKGSSKLVFQIFYSFHSVEVNFKISYVWTSRDFFQGWLTGFLCHRLTLRRVSINPTNVIEKFSELIQYQNELFAHFSKSLFLKLDDSVKLKLELRDNLLSL